MVKFKIGDRVKFTDYDHHEYRSHKDEVAIVTGFERDNDIRVKWVSDNPGSSLAWADEDYWGMHLVIPREVEVAYKKLRKEVERETLDKLMNKQRERTNDQRAKARVTPRLDK